MAKWRETVDSKAGTIINLSDYSAILVALIIFLCHIV